MGTDDDRSVNRPVPPEPDDDASCRREKLMAYHLGALGDDEAALIRGRIEADSEWKRASEEAQSMLDGLKADGVPTERVPEGLGDRTAKKLRDVAASAKKRKHVLDVPSDDSKRPPLDRIPFAFTWRVAAAVFVVASLPALWLGGKYTLSRPDRVSLLWRAEGELAAGAPWAPFLMVRHTTTKEPIAGVTVAASLVADREGAAPVALGEGTSDATGALSGGEWQVPDVPPGDYKLVVEAKSGWGSILDRVEREVKVSTAARLALAPDRAQARPGETIRVRTLLVSEAGSKPLAGKSVVIDLLDPEGNRIGRAEEESTEFGLAWVEFPLDSRAREGTYTLRAEAAGLKAERGVRVKQYRLPAYRVKLALDRSWFGAGDRITGHVRADTFDGRPVGGAKGEAKLIGEDGVVLRRGEITLGPDGSGRMDLPAAGAAAIPEDRAARFRLVLSLVDPAGRRVTETVPVPVSQTPVIVSAVAEAGDLVQGVENIVYLVFRRPDGAPMSGFPFVVTRDGTSQGAPAEKHTVEPDANGVVVVRLGRPRSPAEVLSIHAGGPGVGPHVPWRISLPVRPLLQKGSIAFGALLVRTERAVVTAGESLKVTVLAADRDGTVTIALRQDGRTIAVVGVDLDGGKGEGTIAVPSGVSGMLTLDAMIQVGQRLWTDARVVSVKGDMDVKLAAVVGRPKYRPGDTARIDFSVTDAAGNGIPAAVSVVAVDEALLALTGDHPGLAQALLIAGDSALRKPGFPLDPRRFGPVEGGTLAARAAFSAARPRGPASAWAHIEEMVKAGRLEESSTWGIRRLLSASKRDGASRQRALEWIREPGAREEVASVLSEWVGSEYVQDSGPAKIAANRAGRQATARSVGRMLLGLLLVGIVIALVAEVYRRKAQDAAEARRQTAEMVPFITGTVVMGALVGAAILEAVDLLPFMAFACLALAVGHGLLLPRAKVLGKHTRDKSYSPKPLIAAVVVCDIVAAYVALGVAPQIDSDDNAVLVVFVFIGAFLAFALQRDLAKAQRERGYSLFWRSLAGMVFVAIVGTYFALPFLALRGKMMLMESLGGDGSYSRTSRGETFRGTHELTGAEWASSDLPVPVGPKLRWDFPETLVFAPQVVTDEKGRATLQVPVADSLTTWRVQADAIGARGGTAWTETKLVVTQPFSADLVLPTDVTAGDLLYVPVVVSNHTPLPRVVEIALKATGATATDGDRRTVRVPAMAVASAEFGVRFDAPGTASLEVTALSGGEGDAVRRTLLVIPDGEPVGFAVSSLVNDAGALVVNVPESAIPGTITARLRLHRGPLSQVMEGLEGMLREPYGCFEQTSSTTYPNVLVLQYLRATGARKPQIERKATDYIARGYQRLLGFEVGNKSGSFSLYGKAPASAWLTAYGLMEFTDMAEVHTVDPLVLARIRAWLVSQMKADGSFPIGRRYGSGGLDIAGTAYAVWGLGGDAPEASVKYLMGRVSEIEKDAYLCALVANALVKKDRATVSYLAGKLRGLATFGKEKGGAPSATLTGQRSLAWGYGRTASAETTALGVLALLGTGQDMELAKALTVSLQSNVRGGHGWGSTHATILALKALVRTADVGRKAGPARVVVEVNGKPLAPIDLPAEETAVPASVTLDLPAGESRVSLRVSGGPIAARVSGQAYVPWTGDIRAADSALRASVTYSAKRIKRDTAALGTLSVTARERTAEVPMVEWGMPAGFVPEPDDLDSLKAKGVLSHWEASGRSLRLYLPDLAAGESVTLPVRFYATAKGTLKGPAGRAYEYYRRHDAEAIEPVTLEVF
ncbi:MAG: MG2 domain-containing protein [Planctomycetota bacterium]|jgi:hypothetical protein